MSPGPSFTEDCWLHGRKQGPGQKDPSLESQKSTGRSACWKWQWGESSRPRGFVPMGCTEGAQPDRGSQQSVKMPSKSVAGDEQCQL